MTKRKNKKFRGDTRLLEVYDVGSGGDLVARPADGSPARCIYVASNKKIKPPLEIGDCFLGRVKRVGGNLWAKPFARTSKAGAAMSIISGRHRKMPGWIICLTTSANAGMAILWRPCLSASANSNKRVFSKITGLLI
jgi:hypothetical protein